MRVLVLNQTFHPDVASTAQYASDLAATLVERGHDVTVVCSRRAYDSPSQLYPARETWRGVSIPLVSFELLNNEVLADQLPGARVAVFNCINDSGKLPFFAVLTQGIPRSVKVASSDLIKQNVKVGHAEEMLATLQEQTVVIPNLDYIENTIAKAKIS